MDIMIELFNSIGLTIIVPEVVMEEIFDGRLKQKIYDLEGEGDVKIQVIIKDDYAECASEAMTKIALESNSADFDPGQHEAESLVICLGKSIESEFLLLDEKAAIKVAKKKGLRTMTHVDIIKMCVKNDIITSREGLVFLENLVSSGVKYAPGMLDHYRTVWQ